MRLIRYATPVTRSASSAFARSPWAGLEAQMGRLFEAALTDGVASPGDRFPLDLYEDANATYVRAELPGVKRDDIGVELVDGMLQLTAKRALTQDEHGETQVLRRAITVPEGAVQADKVTATYENGVLTVALPKREEAKPRKISVAVS